MALGTCAFDRGILAFALQSGMLLKGHNSVVIATAKYGSNEQVGEIFKQVNLCNNCLQLGSFKAGCGLSPAASCFGQELITCGEL